jgi:hypothetical protein
MTDPLDLDAIENTFRQFDNNWAHVQMLIAELRQTRRERDEQLSFEEEDRQMILLSLALCHLARPGFTIPLERIAKKLGGMEMFEEFKSMGRATQSTQDPKTG